MKKRPGFTLVELIVVVIVIGILATLAVPQYLKATERAKIAKAKNALGLIAQGQKLYRADNDGYISGADDATLGSYIELSNVDADTDWTYSAVGDASTFTITATRSAGSLANCTITFNQNSVIVDTCTSAL